MALFSFSTPDEMADAVCNTFGTYIKELIQCKEQIHLAISGGTTPRLFFEKLAACQKDASTSTDWTRIHIFWVDERCVPPGHVDSNYGMTRKLLLDDLKLPENQVHRIHGEDDPVKESRRYEHEIRSVFQEPAGMPVFDWIFLGIGDDGHTASIFPDRLDLIESKDLCAVARHASSDRFRVTLTGPILKNARRISFLVTGAKKSEIIRQIILEEPVAKRFPAFYIKPKNGNLDWYLDASAAKQLNL